MNVHPLPLVLTKAASDFSLYSTCFRDEVNALLTLAEALAHIIEDPPGNANGMALTTRALDAQYFAILERLTRAQQGLAISVEELIVGIDEAGV